MKSEEKKALNIIRKNTNYIDAYREMLDNKIEDPDLHWYKYKKECGIDREGGIMEESPLRADEAAEFLKISMRTLYNWAEKRQIPSYKVNDKMLYFKKSDLLDFVFDESNKRDKN